MAGTWLVHRVPLPQTTASVNFPPEQHLYFLIFTEVTQVLQRSCFCSHFMLSEGVRQGQVHSDDTSKDAHSTLL